MSNSNRFQRTGS